MPTRKPRPSLEGLLAETEFRAASDQFKHSRYGPFVEVRKQLEEAGRMKDADRMQWAADAFMFYERRHRGKGESYFGPLSTAGELEAPEWTNMESARIDFYAQRALSAANPIIVSRYADIVWEKRKEHKFARLAGDSYVQAAAIYKERGWYLQMAGTLVRAAELALVLRDRDLLRERLTTLQQYLGWIDATQNYECGLQLVDALAEIPKRWISHDLLKSAEQFALKAAGHYRSLGGDDLFSERDFLELVRKIRIRIGDSSGASEAARMIAESFEKNAKFREGDSPIEASGLYNRALQLYGGLADRRKVQELLLKIRDCNARALKEFAVIRSEIKVSSEEIEKLIDQYTSASLDENLRRLSMGFWPNIEAIRESTTGLKHETPLQFSIPMLIFSGDARVVGQISKEEDLFEQQMVQQVRVGYQLNAKFIADILRRLAAQQGLNAERVADFLCGSQVIGNGRRDFLNLGLARYFAGDYVSAIHVLVPQLEHVLRSVLPRIHIADTYDDRGIMRVLPLQQILGTPQVANAFGKGLWLYFHTFLVDQDAENVRNDVAHGLIEWERCNETIATIVVHLLLILTVFRFEA